MWAAEKLFHLSGSAASKQEAGSLAASWAPAATFASVATLGSAAVTGALSLGVAVAAMGALGGAAQAMASGGIVEGGRQFIQVNEAGREAVLNARATSFLGDNFIHSLNAGRFASATSRMPMAGSTQGGSSQTHFLLVDSRNSQAARDYLESAKGQVHIINIVRNNKTTMGIG